MARGRRGYWNPKTYTQSPRGRRRRERGTDHRRGGVPDFLPEPGEIAENLIPSAARAAHAVGGFVQDAWDISRTPLSHLVQPGIQSRGEQLLYEQQAQFQSIGTELWRSAMDPNAGLLDHLRQPEQYPVLSGVAQSTPFGPQGWGGFVQHLEQEPAEWAVGLGLSAVGAGGLAAAYRTSRVLPSPTPMQQFARQWNEVELSGPVRVSGIDAPEMHAGGQPIRNYDLEGAYDAPRVNTTAFEQLRDSRPRWETEPASEAQLSALRAQYPDRDFSGMSKKEASNALSFEFHEQMYEGDVVDYQKAAALGVDLPDPRSAVEAQSWRAPEYAQGPDVLEWGRRRTEAVERMGMYEPEYRLLDRGADAPERGSAQFSIYGTPEPASSFGPEPRWRVGHDYHSGEISGNKFSLGVGELAIGGGVSLGVGGGAYGWHHYFGGEPAYERPVIPHFSETERAEATRQIEGGGMASEKQLTALARMYPDKDLSNITKSEASGLFDSYVKPERGAKMATDAQVSAIMRGFEGQQEAEPANWLNTNIEDGITRDEASHLFSSLALKRAMDSAPRSRGIGPEPEAKVETERMASDAQLSALNRAFGVQEPTEPANWLNVNIEDGVSAREAGHLFASLEVRKQLRTSGAQQAEPTGEPMASEGQLRALGRIFSGGQAQTEAEPANWLNTNIEDGVTRQEAAHLFASAEVARGLRQGRGGTRTEPMASESQVAALRRIYPDRFGEPEEEPLVSLEEIDFTDGVTREEARQAFRHVPDSPPPMASKRAVAALEARFPHAFKQLGDASEYLASGQSYGIVQSLEDIYDADTFTGQLYDAETGTLFKEDTVRLGDFNAPEIKPDQFKPKEYQEREAARAREARDVFRSLVERYNVGRDTEQEGYVIPIQYRHDETLPGGLDRGFYGRVLGDVNFEGIDYEHFMIQQGMGSVYGANVEWGAEEIDPASLWRRSPTLQQRLGSQVRGTLESIPANLIEGVLGGQSPVDTLGQMFQNPVGQAGEILKSEVKETLKTAATDFVKETFTDDFTPSGAGFVERYIGDLGGIGEKARGFGGEFLGSALAPAALAAGTFLVGERSLDAGYEEVVASASDRRDAFNAQFRGVHREMRGGVASSEGAMLQQIEQIFRRVLGEMQAGSFDKAVTRIGRQSKINVLRGLS